MAHENLNVRKQFMFFDGGLATQEEPNKIADNQSPDLVNCRPIGRGAYGMRNGISRVGDADTNQGSRKSIYNFTKVGTQTLVSSKLTTLQYLNSETWTDIPGVPTFTADQRFGFANDETYLYGCNGVDDFFVWNGGTKANTVFTADHNTDIFTSAGHGLANGDQIVFVNSGGALPTGLSANTFYYVISVTTDTFQVSTTFGGGALNFSNNGSGTNYFHKGMITVSGNPKGKILANYVGRLFIAGMSDGKATVKWTAVKASTLALPDFSGTGSGTQVLGDGGDEITAMRIFTIPAGDRAGDKGLFIFKKSTRVYQCLFDSTGTISFKEILVGKGARNNQSTITVENDLFFVDNGNNVANLGFREGIQNQIRSESTTSGIDKTTYDASFDDACAVYFPKRRMVMLTYKSYGSLFNDKTIVYFYDFGSWWSWDGVNANEYAIYNDEIVWASSTDLNVYKYDETKFDDLENPIRSYRATKDVEYEDKNGMPIMDHYKQTRFIIVRGFISPAGRMALNALFEGNQDIIQTAEFGGTDEDITSENVSIYFGSNVFGSQIFGGGISSPTNFPLREFLVVLSLDAYSASRVRLIPEVQGVGTPYLITMISFWGELQADEKFPNSIKI